MTQTPTPCSQPSITLVMPTIGWDDTFCRCARGALAGLGPADQCLIVFDGVPPPPPAWLVASAATLLSTGCRSGPGAARNLAVLAARSELVFFVDADVEVHLDTVDRLRARFAADPELTAVFGSYDDRPAAPGVVSRFRNLLHHHTHSSHPGPATTFWAGCGAVRRDAFLALGGFDAITYQRPSIEDIEFGLRLSEAGARIELDPTIQGTHHKRWTFRSMLVTDIGQRAIPWSRLLWRRRHLPSTLNLTPAARLSAGASLLMVFALPGLALSDQRAWFLAAICVALGLFLLLNRPFHQLLLRRSGWLDGSIGVGLHAFYLFYSSLVFTLVALAEIAGRPLPQPAWLGASPRLRRGLTLGGLVLLALLACAVLAKGLVLGWRFNGQGDMYQRLDEWRLFRDGIYPSAQLATPEQRSMPYFRSTVYLPWALPLFAVFFAWGGALQGKVLIQSLSLISLALMAAVGWHSLKPWGRSAAWLGALAPLAIAANSNALAQGQFSIVCLGLITLQWLLLARGLPLPAGLAWALAMVKPQIAAGYALPLLLRGHRRGLALGLVLLAGLSALALVHTHTPPLAFLVSWLAVLPHFIGAGNRNAAAALLALGQAARHSWWMASGALVLGAISIVAVLSWWLRSRALAAPPVRPPGEPSLAQAGAGGQRWQAGLSWCGRAWRQDPLAVAGLAAVLGQVSLYHLSMDNIMLFPALVVSWRLFLMRPRILEAALTLLMSLSLWTPQRLLDVLPGSAMAQGLIWLTLAAVLVWKLGDCAGVERRPPSLSRP